MSKSQEQKLLEKLYKKITDDGREWQASEFLFTLLEDYPQSSSQKHFFLINRVVNDLSISVDSSADVITTIKAINSIPYEQLFGSFDLLLRIKVFCQLFPEFIKHLQETHQELLKIMPAYYQLKEEIKKEISRPTNRSGYEYLNLSVSMGRVFLQHYPMVDGYVSFLRQGVKEERILHLGELIPSADVFSKISYDVHNFILNVLRNFATELPESLVPKLQLYLQWILAYLSLFSFPVAILQLIGVLHKFGKEFPLTETDRQGPIRDSRILGLVQYLFCNESTIAGSNEIFEALIDWLPTAFDTMYDEVMNRIPICTRAEVLMILKNIDKASELQRIALLQELSCKYAIGELNPWLMAYANLFIAYEKSLKNFMLEVMAKRDKSNVNCFISYMNLYAITNNKQETFLNLKALLVTYLSTHDYCVHILKKIKDVFPILSTEERISIAEICKPVLTKYSEIVIVLKFWCEKSLRLKKHFTNMLLEVLDELIITNKDDEFIKQFSKFSIFFSGKRIALLDDGYFNDISSKLCQIVENDIDGYLQEVRRISDIETVRHNVDQLRQVQTIVTDLRDFLPSSTFIKLAEQLYPYLNDRHTCNKIHTLKFLAENFQYFSSDDQERLFALLLPKVLVGYPLEDPGRLYHTYSGTVPKDTFNQLLKAFSLNSDKSLNIKKVDLILNYLLARYPTISLSYVDTFNNHQQNFIEKFALIRINSKIVYESNDIVHIVLKENNQEIARRQYSRYHSDFIRSLVACEFNQAEHDGVVDVIMEYATGSSQKFCKV